MLPRTLCTQDTTNTLHVKYLSPFEEWRPRHISPTNGTSGDMCAMMGHLFCDGFYVLTKVFGIDLYMAQVEAHGLMKQSFFLVHTSPFDMLYQVESLSKFFKNSKQKMILV